MRRLALAALLVVAACKEERPLATLLELEGPVESSRAGAAFVAATKGEAYALGDAVRTGAGATARVQLRDSGVVRVKPESVLRFGRSAKKSLKLDVDLGEAEIETQTAMAFETDLGAAVLEPGSKVRLRSEKRGVAYEILVGAATIDAIGGERLDLKVGDAVIDEDGKAHRYTVDIDNAVIDPHRPRPDAGVVAARPDAAPPAAAAAVATVVGSASKIRRVGETWHDLPAGEVSVAAADELRVGKGSIEVRRGNERVTLETGAEAKVGGGGDPLVALNRGRATFEEVAVAVPGGVIRARGGALAAVAVDAGGASVSVERGEVSVDSGGKSETVRRGERGVVGKSGGVEVADRAPATYDLVVSAGESATIHDLAKSRPLRVSFGGLCAAEGLLEIPGKKRWVAVGRDGANLLLGASAVRYQVRCVADGVEGPPRAAGTLRAQADSGSAKIVKSPPQNTLEADGRRYTVLYQNRLPVLTLRWAGGGAEGDYELHVQPKSGGHQVVKLSAPSHTLELREGEYTWWYTLPAARRRSPSTTVRIGFDNAAATVQITSPDAGATFAGQATTVAGVVLEGSRVSVDGAAAPLDPQNRFSVDVAAPGPVLVIRVEHPRLGVHYYVRRSK